MVSTATTNRPAGQLDLGSALAPYAGPWNARLAAHLLRRAGFGGSPTEVSRLAAMRPHEAVESLIHFPSTGSLPQPDNVFDPYAQGLLPLQRMRGMQIDDMTRRGRLQDIRKSARQSIISLQKWWLDRMVATPAPAGASLMYL